MIKKRQSQLEMIQRDVQTQINQKRLLIQETETRMEEETRRKNVGREGYKREDGKIR